MSILLNLYPYGYISKTIPLWVYIDTYTLMGIYIRIPLWVHINTYTPMGIFLNIYPHGYISIPIPLWVYIYLYPQGYILIPIPWWVYTDVYTLMSMYIYLYPYGYISIFIPQWVQSKNLTNKYRGSRYRGRCWMIWTIFLPRLIFNRNFLDYVENLEINKCFDQISNVKQYFLKSRGILTIS